MRSSGVASGRWRSDKRSRNVLGRLAISISEASGTSSMEGVESCEATGRRSTRLGRVSGWLK